MRILFLFIGEPHHLFHVIPIAAELARSDADIEIAVSGEEHHAYLAAFLKACPALRRVNIRTLSASCWRAAFAATPLGRSQMRLPTLLSALPYLRGFDAIVVPERTTTAIRRLLGKQTKLIFTPHGAGDRAIMLDPRDALFDFVLVAGSKSERRLLDAGTIRPGAYAVPGYVKLDYLSRLAPCTERSFGNGRETVLYAPHFRSELSSWWRFGREVIEQFRAQDDYNLIVAPHIRLFHGASARQRRAWEALAEPGKILIDTGSPKLTDMHYTREADFYLGDVSSQVYEFVASPRPCIFLDAHATDWRGNADYAFWNMGEVVADTGLFMAAVRRARKGHPLYLARQRAGIVSSFGRVTGAAQRSATAILCYLQGGPARRRGSGGVLEACPELSVRDVQGLLEKAQG
jgi:hypothetical protein